MHNMQRHGEREREGGYKDELLITVFGIKELRTELFNTGRMMRMDNHTDPRSVM